MAGVVRHQPSIAQSARLEVPTEAAQLTHGAIREALRVALDSSVSMMRFFAVVS